MKTFWALSATVLLPGGCQPPATPKVVDNGIDPNKATPQDMCTTAYKPMCGRHGKMYPPPCVAANAGVLHTMPGPCPTAPAK